MLVDNFSYNRQSDSSSFWIVRWRESLKQLENLLLMRGINANLYGKFQNQFLTAAYACFDLENNKLRYAYFLTPAGLSEKAGLTGRFLARKMAEYEALTAEIEALRRDMKARDMKGTGE